MVHHPKHLFCQQMGVGSQSSSVGPAQLGAMRETLVLQGTSTQLLEFPSLGCTQVVRKKEEK